MLAYALLMGSVDFNAIIGTLNCQSLNVQTSADEGIHCIGSQFKKFTLKETETT